MCFLRHAHYKMQFEPWWKRATRLNQVWSCAVPSLAGGRLDSLRAGCPPKPRYSAGMEQINRWFFPHHSMPISYHLPISMGELLSESLIFRLGHADTYQNQSLYMGLTGAKKSRSTIFWDQFWLNISDHTIYNIYIYYGLYGLYILAAHMTTKHFDAKRGVTGWSFRITSLFRGSRDHRGDL